MGDEAFQRRLILAGLLAVELLVLPWSAHRLQPFLLHGLAGDWGVFYAAGELVRHAVSPYDQVGLVAVEKDLHPGFIVGDFPYLPIVAWALTPLVRLPFWVSLQHWGSPVFS